MKKHYSISIPHCLPPAVLALSLLAIYLRTLAPGLSWANNGADGADLITAVVTGGIPHPTGYPLYILLAELFQALPVGSLAFRTNLLSAIATSLAAVLLYMTVVRFLDVESPGHSWPAGLVAGYAFGLAPLVWSQAVITEVYALQALLTALVMYFFTAGWIAQKNQDRLRGLSLGLAMGNHITAIFLAPLVIFGNAGRRSSPSRDGSFDYQAILSRSLFVFVGLAVYLILPWRASSNPPINWGNPSTPDGLWWLVSGRLYAENLHSLTGAEALSRIQAWADLLMGQWGLLGLSLAFFGLAFTFSPSNLYTFTIWQAVFYSAFAMLYDSPDSYVYLIPVCISFSIWIGLGLSGMMNSTFAQRYGRGIPIFLVCLLYLFGLAAYHMPQVDASKDLRAESFGREVISIAPQDAIVFAKGDRAVFTLWYFQFALDERPDIAIVATDLLHFDWYAEMLRRHNVSLKIPAPFPWPETIIHNNPSLPVCYVESAEQPLIDCRQPEGN